jgi:hypothetical protein
VAYFRISELWYRDLVLGLPRHRARMLTNNWYLLHRQCWRFCLVMLVSLIEINFNDLQLDHKLPQFIYCKQTIKCKFIGMFRQSSHTVIRCVGWYLILYVISLLSNASGPVVQKFPDSIKVKTYGWVVSHSCTYFILSLENFHPRNASLKFPKW